MSKTFKNDKVIYVEPNIMDESTSYNGNVYKSVELEDMSIYVGLEVEMKGNIYRTANSGGESSITKLTWQSGVDGQKISFMKGTRINSQNKETPLTSINCIVTSGIIKLS